MGLSNITHTHTHTRIEVYVERKNVTHFTMNDNIRNFIINIQCTTLYNTIKDWFYNKLYGNYVLLGCQLMATNDKLLAHTHITFAYQMCITTTDFTNKWKWNSAGNQMGRFDYDSDYILMKRDKFVGDLLWYIYSANLFAVVHL